MTPTKSGRITRTSARARFARARACEPNSRTSVGYMFFRSPLGRRLNARVTGRLEKRLLQVVLRSFGNAMRRVVVGRSHVARSPLVAWRQLRPAVVDERAHAIPLALWRVGAATVKALVAGNQIGPVGAEPVHRDVLHLAAEVEVD